MATLGNQEWNIRSRSDACMHCNRNFDDGEAFQTELLWNDEGYARMDWCMICWKTREHTTTISTWKAVFRKPPPKPEEPLKKETAESLLRHLVENEAHDQADVIFVLTVMLERRKQLIERNVAFTEDGGKLRIYEHKGTGESFVIRDPELKLDELEPVQIRVIALLDGRHPEWSTAELEGEQQDGP